VDYTSRSLLIRIWRNLIIQFFQGLLVDNFHFPPDVT